MNMNPENCRKIIIDKINEYLIQLHDLPSGIFIELMAIDDCQEDYPLLPMSNGRGVVMNNG